MKKKVIFGLFVLLIALLLILILLRPRDGGQVIDNVEINHEFESDSNDPNDWGVTLTVENATPLSATIKCEQSGGNPTGKLQTGGRYVIETWTEEKGWQEVPYYAEVAWTMEGYLIPENGVTEWKVEWGWLYGELSVGKYRIGKDIMDFRDTGDYDMKMMFAEFEIK